ncbi:MAG: phosphotransferase family protein [Prosthecobacter sp.]
MSRREIHYWKCDRPSAFHRLQTRALADAEVSPELEKQLCRFFNTPNIVLSRGRGQGNHLTWNAEVDGKPCFIRVENGPEKDAHLAVESTLLDRVREAGVRTPRVFGCDASRTRVPFAWQALERVSAPDLNQWFKQGTLDLPKIAFEIGAAVAKWQAITFENFGVLDESLRGYRTSYADYFNLRLDEHLRFLVDRGFLNNTDEIQEVIEEHCSILDLTQGCLVHKDLALWNILGTGKQIVAFIDFDDAICGDPMDDLSLLACFHDALFLQRAFEGYQSVRRLPEDPVRRFWLHLLRNMIVKAVIRVGTGYFDHDDSFFLIGSGSSGATLRETTLAKLNTALRGLREGAGLDIL